MEPIVFLWLLIGITALAGGAQWVVRAKHAKRLGRVARQWGMTYVHADRFRLAARVGPLLPSGGGKIVISDVMYQTTGGRRRYLFTVDMTEERAACQRTRRCVAAVEEEIAAPGETQKPLVIRMGREGAGVMEQYEGLRGAGERSHSGSGVA